ncbi:hypothetical protein AMK59_8373 [Oryctes borbonicus]|uniref:Uncharacterized protein n=1 Tax=Oryctes borbonicus TaxID=1629725 RepID=A0A0T6AU59_9SCAR|nr:hypothetical protein AMK59_8373 [Oryctes borbonicus]
MFPVMESGIQGALSFHMPFSKLRLLDISHNKIGDDGMIDILNSLKKPYSLRLFYIWGNFIKQRTFWVLERMLLSKVLEQDNIDVKIYSVDGVLYHAYYPSDRYKHKYYCEMDHGSPIELRIKRNKVELNYSVDGVLYHAYYPSDRYKHKYYCEMDHGSPIELRIKRNKVELNNAQPRSLVKFQFYPRVPPADDRLPPKNKPC